LSVHCIECIYQWKQSIEPLLPRNTKLRYLANGKSYMPKFIEDYKMITATRIAEVYGFEQKRPDVFFLNYTFEGKKMSVVSKNILKRIRYCEMLLAEEEGQEVEEEESKRTPLIQKNSKVSPGRQDKSVPPKGPTSILMGNWKKMHIEYGEFQEYFVNSISKSAFSQSFYTVVEMSKYEEMTVFQNSENGEEIVLAIDKNASQRKIIILSVKSTLETI
jgi:hypothetical protein